MRLECFVVTILAAAVSRVFLISSLEKLNFAETTPSRYSEGTSNQAGWN